MSTTEAAAEHRRQVAVLQGPPDDLGWLVTAASLELPAVQEAVAGLRRRGLLEFGAEVEVASAALRLPLSMAEATVVDALLGVQRDSRHPHVTRRAGVLGAAPTVSGTRIPTESIAGYFRAGKGVWDVQRDFPYLTADEIFDALHFELDRSLDQAGKVA